VRRFRFARAVVTLAGVFGTLLVGARADAFERQWHFGAGGGIASAGDGYALGPAIGLHAAYGLSDVFDARLELLVSQHARASAGLPVDRFYGGKLGVAYKLDVIQWIPYVGVSAGFLGVVEPRAPYRATQATLGLVGGLDYAVARSFGLGVVATADYVLGPTATMTAGLLRAEYRFGW
jgi:hypothetical protein